MIKCNNCGMLLSGECNFCTKCGSKIDNVVTSVANDSVKKNKKSFAWCFGITILIVLSIIFLIFAVDFCLRIVNVQLNESITSLLNFLRVGLPILLILFMPMILYAVKNR